MSNSGKCQICGSEIKIYDYDIRNDRQAFDCSHCGRFYFLYSFEPDISNEQKNDFYKVSSWIYEQNNEFNNVPEIDEEKFVAVLNMPAKKIKEKFDLLMNYLAKIPSKETSIDHIKVACWMKDDEELGALLTKTIDMEYVNGVGVEKSLAGTYIIIYVPARDFSTPTPFTYSISIVFVSKAPSSSSSFIQQATLM